MVVVWAQLFPAAWAYQFTDDFKNGAHLLSFPFAFSVASISDSNTVSIIEDAMQEWENSLNFDIWSLNTDTSNVNAIRWSDQFGQETGLDETTTLAVTTRNAYGPYLRKVEIILNSKFPHLRENADNVLYRTVLHELGHTIGLDHSDVVSTVMSAYLTGLESLTYDDLQGAQAAITETQRRQKIDEQLGVTEESLRTSSALKTSNTGGVPSCGTIQDLKSAGSSKGAKNNVASMLIGTLTLILAIRFSSYFLRWPFFVRS